MILIHDFDKFFSIIDAFKGQNVQTFLYGKMKEDFSGVYLGMDTPPNNILSIQALALTSVGTFYCHDTIKLSDPDRVEKAKELYRKLSVIEAELTHNIQTGCVTIK